MLINENLSFVRYLSAKKSIDDRALNRTVWNHLWTVLPRSDKKRPLRILELGGGIGTMAERMIEAGRLTHADYTSVEIEAVLTAESRQKVINWTARENFELSWSSKNTAFLQKENDQFTLKFVQANIFDFFKNDDFNQKWDLGLAHAFMDLVNPEDVLPQFCAVIKPGGFLYLTLNYDGETILMPTLDPCLDKHIIRLYNQSMDERTIDGRKSGDSQTEAQASSNGIGDKIKPALAFIGAWLFLNILMNINYPAPQEHLISLLTISPEILFLVGIIGAAIWLGMPYHWGIYLPLTILVIFFRLFRVADELVPMYFFRPFNLYIDSQFLPDLIHLLYHTLPLKTFIIYSVLSLLLTVGIFLGIWLSFKTIHQYLAGLNKGGIIPGTAIVVLGLLLLFSGAEFKKLSPIFHKGFYHRIVEETDFILHVKGYRTQKLRVIKKTTRRLEQAPSSLDRLAGVDVYLIFVESYGYTVFEDKRHFHLIKPFLQQYENDLSAQGFSVYSGFLKSPTFGGSSWLAHGTIASGVALSSQLVYDLLVTSDATTIGHIFNRAGYRTVSAMPGTLWPWPEGKFFGYQKHYFARDFEYNGPQFGWSPMADQYVLQYIYQKEILARTQPLFIEFVLISSHAPFHRQPPYIKNWSQIGDGSIYHRREAVTFPVVWPDLTNASEAYVTSIIYEIKVLKNFIEQYIKNDTLIIILGDHQPNVQITGPDSSWSVPVHVISRNKRFLDPFKNKGYTPGLIPGQTPPHPGMETFFLDFLKSFSSSDRAK